MKAMVVDARVFSDAMAKVSRVLKKCPIPILSEISVSVRDGVCTLTATDLETWLTAQIPAMGEDMDFVFCKTKDVLKVCAQLDGDLTIELYEQPEEPRAARKLRLCCGQRIAEYDATSNEDYPRIVSVESDTVFRTNAAHLLERIERVRYAAVKPGKNTRPYGTCVQFKDQRIFSLDGHRMACDTQEEQKVPAPFLAQGCSLSHLKVFGKNDVTVRVGVHYILFTDEEASLYVRRYGVDTFNVDAVVPKQYLETIKVGTTDFIKELRYLKKCAAANSRPYVRFVGEQLTMSVPDGKFQTSIHVIGRGDLTLSFGLQSMLDALKQFKNVPEVTVKLSGAFSPIVIEAEGRSDFALILPVRIKEEMAA